MKPETPPPASQPPVLSINYLKLTASLVTVVIVWAIINDWEAFKAGLQGTRLP